MKKLVLLTAALAMGMTAGATDDIDTIQVDHIYSRSHVGAYVGAGIHSFMADPRGGEFEHGWGNMAGVQYQYIFKNSFGFGIGAQISRFASSASYQRPAEVANGIIVNKSRVTEFTEYTAWEENQTMYMIEVPVQFLFDGRLGKGNWNFQAGLGATLQFPLSGEFSSDGFSKTLSGYTPDRKPVSDRKYTTTDYPGVSGDLSDIAGFGIGLQADLGFRYDFCKAMGLYAGIYSNCGVMDVMGANDKTYFSYTDVDYNDVFSTTEVDKVIPVELGLKVAMRFNFRNRKAERAAKEMIALERSEKARAAAEKAADEAAGRERLAKDEAARNRAEADRLIREAAERERLAREARYESLRSIDRAAGFGVNSAKVNEIDNNAVNFRELGQCMADFPEMKVVVTGHTDSTGSDERNMELGQKRAELYRDLLVENGIDAGRIECKSAGKNMPVADNATAEGRRLNRRVSIELVK